MKKGFTLAEVLVTVAIVGIVAAITIPLMGQSYEKRAQYTAFIKMYSTLKSVMSLAEVDHKKPDRWVFDNNNASQTSKANIYPYLKISKICEEAQCVNYTITNLTANDSGNASIFMQGNGRTVFLEDGTILAVLYDYSNGHIEGIMFFFDTNGEKGPNIIGRDVFVMYYTIVNGSWTFELEGQHYGAQECDTSNSESTGQGCPSRLIEEGKMAY